MNDMPNEVYLIQSCGHKEFEAEWQRLGRETYSEIRNTDKILLTLEEAEAKRYSYTSSLAYVNKNKAYAEMHLRNRTFSRRYERLYFVRRLLVVL